MTDVELAYRAILLSPEDDLVRLAHADALEEVGEVERAEYIRAAIEYDNTPSHLFWLDDRPEWVEKIIQREYELRQKFVNEWWDDSLSIHLRWRRGFPQRATITTLAEWMKKGKDILLTHPITEVHWLGKSPTYHNNWEDFRWGFYSYDEWIDEESLEIDDVLGDIWDRMEGRLRNGGGWRCYPTGTAAIADVSQVLIALAKEKM